MAFRDSMGNSYDHVPSGKKKGAKGAKPGPKHGRKSNYVGPKKAHGLMTHKNGSPFYVHLLAHSIRQRSGPTKWGMASGSLELGR